MSDSYWPEEPEMSYGYTRGTAAQEFTNDLNSKLYGQDCIADILNEFFFHRERDIISNLIENNNKTISIKQFYRDIIDGKVEY